MARGVGEELRRSAGGLWKVAVGFLPHRDPLPVLPALDEKESVVDVTSVSTEESAAIDEQPVDEPPAERPATVGPDVDRTETAVPEPQPTPSWDPVDVGSAAPVIGKVLPGNGPWLKAAVPYRPASCTADGTRIERYHLAAASQIGLGHSADGTVRQDSYNFALTTSGRLVLGVADGMGSRPHSQVGAAHFCDSVAIAAATAPDGSAADYLRAAAERVEKIAEAVYGLQRDAVSFVAAVAVIDGDRCEVVRVGDVSAFVVETTGEMRELFASDDGHVNVVGSSLPSADPIEPEAAEAQAVPRLVLATDGLANDLRTSAAVRAWTGAIWAGLPTAHAMLDALRYRRRGSHDDRTAVVVAIPDSLGAPGVDGDREIAR